MPIVNRWGHPFAAISVGAIGRSRMGRERQGEIAETIRTEVRLLEKAMRDATMQ